MAGLAGSGTTTSAWSGASRAGSAAGVAMAGLSAPVVLSMASTLMKVTSKKALTPAVGTPGKAAKGIWVAAVGVMAGAPVAA